MSASATQGGHNKYEEHDKREKNICFDKCQ